MLNRKRKLDDDADFSLSTDTATTVSKKKRHQPVTTSPTANTQPKCSVTKKYVAPPPPTAADVSHTWSNLPQVIY